MFPWFLERHPKTPEASVRYTSYKEDVFTDIRLCPEEGVGGGEQSAEGGGESCFEKWEGGCSSLECVYSEFLS